MELRPYQYAAIYGDETQNGILTEWDEVDRTLLVLPTGAGKTIVFCKLTEKCVSEGKRVLILAHRGELLDQAADKMQKATGLGCSMEKAESTSLGEWKRITVGSVQTMMREKRLKTFATDHFDVIIVDEAHHVLSDSYLRVLDYFEHAKVLGVTATPDRGDMKNLGQFFETLAYEYTLPEAIRDGFLVPIKAQTIPLQLDMTGIKKTGGDYNVAAVGNALDPYLEQIAEEVANRCGNYKTVIFTPLIATSKKLAGFLSRHNMSVAEVNGDTPDRDQRLKRFDAAGNGSVMLNSMLLTEGWDCPSVSCVIVLRATKMRGLYTQMVGRGTRPSPDTGKEHLLLLDFLWHTEKHDLCRPAHLICENAEVADTMTESINGSPMPVDLGEAVEQAEQDTVAAREEALAKKLSELKHKKAKLVDPLQFEMSIQSEDLVNYVPAFGWETEAPSASQSESLAKLDINPTSVDSAGKAQKLIDAATARQSSGMSSPKQIRQLEQRGFMHVGKWEFAQAKSLIDRVAANRWITPRNITPSTYVPPPSKPTDQSAFEFN